MRIRDPVRRISSAIPSPLRAGLTGAAIPAACAARVAAKSWEVLGPQSVTASGRRTPRLARPLAIRVTVPARAVYVQVRESVEAAGSGIHWVAMPSGQVRAA